jgi:hypothetical protein
MVDNMTKQNMNHSSVKPLTVMADNKPPQHEPLFCQTLKSNGRQYNNNNINHSSLKP